MDLRILRLDKSGFPTAWASREEAVVLYVRDQVIWSLGEANLRIVGGVNRQGQRSVVEMSPIIACDGHIPACHRVQHFIPPLSNRLLFRRDGHRCMYCGYQYYESQLTRDHVSPKVQGGRDHWTNVVAACRRCNQQKGGMTPEQANMPLLAIPFVPNAFEFMYLANRQILGDQMDYLKARFSGRRAWLSAA